LRRITAMHLLLFTPSVNISILAEKTNPILTTAHLVYLPWALVGVSTARGNMKDV
jgi:hypothetical protein